MTIGDPDKFYIQERMSEQRRPLREYVVIGLLAVGVGVTVVLALAAVGVG